MRVAQAWVLLIVLLAWLLRENPLGFAATGLFLGILIANTVRAPKAFGPTIHSMGGPALFAAVVLLGFRMEADVIQASAGYLPIVLLVVPVGIFGGWLLARAFGLPGRLGWLIGVGTGVCGASAIAALRPALDADEDEAGLAVAGIMMASTIGLLLLPVLMLGLGWAGPLAGAWAGLSLQAVPHALGAAAPLGPDAEATAAVTKMARVALLPVIVLLASWRRSKMPMEVAGFFGTALLLNLNVLPAAWTAFLAAGASWLLAVGLTAIGLQMDLRKQRPGKVALVAVVAGAVMAGVAWVFLNP